ncbi:MAG: N-acetylmuramoyl-L-alanine amidase [Eubacterium sp.]|jgi:hypothetical protein|nr:N-acetylmuramoyl-L-alanine amidase [Eubacterium sp.]
MTPKTRRKTILAAYEKTSPNGRFPRSGRKIRRITVHHMAGNLSIEACLAMPKIQKQDNVNGMSVNYAIGSDGRVGLGLAETNEAWTSSSRVNDGEAITFEIANCGGAPNWTVSDKAMASFVDAAVDICKFYGYKQILYKEKPSDITPNAVEDWIKTWSTGNEMILTLHNWFAATACPGPFLQSKIPTLVKSINDRLKADSEDKANNETGSFEPYEVVVTTALNVRKRPGVLADNPPVVTLQKSGVRYTIVEIVSGPDQSGSLTDWGKLKSGAGYVCLNYTKRV